MQLHVALGGEAGDDNEEDEDTSDEEFTLDKNAEDGASDSGSASDSDVGEDEDEDEGDFEDGEGEEQDVALDDVESVDEDAVPRQKIEIDNTVRLTAFLLFIYSIENISSGRPRAHPRNHPARPVPPMDRDARAHIPQHHRRGRRRRP
jgi:hypothetical protein